MTDAGSLRVGHEEREHVVLVLTQQYAEERLSALELEQLSADARTARTFAELDRLVSDLPVVPPSVELRRASTTADLSRLGADPDHRLSLSGGMSSQVRRGVWAVPPYLNLSAQMATVKLDFQQAICPHPVVDISVHGGIGAVVLVLPDGWGANTDQVVKGMGSVSNKVDVVPQPRQPLLVLHGTPGVGAVRVRYARWGDKRMMRRAMRRTTADPRNADYVGGVNTPVGPVRGRPASGPQDAPPTPSDPASRPR